MEKKFTFISDTHMKHRHLNLEGGFCLVFSGDCMTHGYDVTELEDFLKWFSEQNYTYKVFVAGNHDRAIEAYPEEQARDVVEKYYDKGVRYLFNNMVEIENYKFFGTPHQPIFGGWAFNTPPDELTDIYSMIPEGLDFLITHCPPKNTLDKSHMKTYRNPTGEEPLGSEELQERLKEMSNPPRYHVFGHIHGDGGEVLKTEKTTYINASVCDEGYRPTNKIISLLIKPNTNVF